MILPLVAALAGCSATPSLASTASPGPAAPTTPVPTGTSAAPKPGPTPVQAGLLEPSGAPLGEPTFAQLQATPDGFLATGWTTDYSAAVLATSGADGQTWVPLDAARVFDRPLAGVATGPHGWVAAEQVDSADGGTAARMFWSADGHAWERLPDQADLERSFPGPISSGRWGFAMLGQAIDAQGTSFPATWVSRDGKVWQQAPPGRDTEPQQVVVVDDGVLVLGYQSSSFTPDGTQWIDGAPVPGADAASSVTATAAGGSDLLVALTSDRSPTFVRGHIDSTAAGNVVQWSDAGLELPAHTNVTGFAAGPRGAVVLGFDRAGQRPEAWSSGTGSGWEHADLDAATFDGGSPGMVAAGDHAFVTLGSKVNDLGIARTRAWVSTDGLHWQQVGAESLGAFPAPPADSCPGTDPTDVQALLDMVAADSMTSGAVWPRCYGRRELSFRAYVHDCGGCGGASPYLARPAWLLDSLGYAAFWLATKPGHGSTPLAIQVDPSHPVRTPRSGAHVRITGHFDDPASASCRLIPDISVISELAPPGVAIATCRQEFVVTSLRILAN